MEIVINTTRPIEVEIGLTGLRQISQELKTLLATRKGSVVMDRDFGLDWAVIDRASPFAKQLFIAEVARQINKYVPRVSYKSIEFLPNAETADGVLACNVIVEVREEYINELS